MHTITPQAKLIRFALTLGLLIQTLLPAVAPTYAFPAQPAAPEGGHAPDVYEPAPSDGAPVGTLYFSAEVDTDGLPHTNPAGAVPVHRYGVSDPNGDATHFASVTLAAVVRPDVANSNPASTVVNFRIWNDAGLELIKQTEADAWGAAVAEWTFDESRLEGPFWYEAWAAGFGRTEPRTFTFDRSNIVTDTHLDGVIINTHVGPDGLLTVDLRSQHPIDDRILASHIFGAKLEGSPDGTPVTNEYLPPLIAERIDPFSARATVYLDPGDYLIYGGIESGTLEAQSAPALVHIPANNAPAVATVEMADEQHEDGSARIFYRTPNGQLAVRRLPTADLAADAFPQKSEPKGFHQTFREGPFKWRTESFSLDLEQIGGEGKKLISLTDFSYDPIARDYTVRIDSLLEEAVADKVTIDVYGPNGVIIYSETNDVWLDPEEPLLYNFTLPAEAGEAYGLRVIVHDPEVVTWLIDKVSVGVRGLRGALTSGESKPSLAFKAELKIVGIKVAEAGITCISGEQCTSGTDGLLFASNSSQAFNIVLVGVRNYLQSTFGGDIDDVLESLAVGGLPLGGLDIKAEIGGRFFKQMLEGNCATPEERAAAEDRASNIGSQIKEITIQVNIALDGFQPTFQNAASISVPLPPLPFILFRFGPILAFQLDAGQDEAIQTRLFFEMKWEIGVSAGVALSAGSLVALLQTFPKLVRLLQKAHILLTIIRNARLASDIASNASPVRTAGCPDDDGGGGGGDDPVDPLPPGDPPDDRQDAYQNEFLAIPHDTNARIAYLEQEILSAESLGLTHAVSYFTLQLREAELLAFQSDSEKALAYLAELEQIAAQGEVRAAAIVSGTTPPLPGMTITETLEAEINNTLSLAENTAWDGEQDALIDAVDFAQAQYDQLRGQELQLQAELRQLRERPGIGVLYGGFIRWTLGAMNSLGLRPRVVNILPNQYEGIFRVGSQRFTPGYFFRGYESPFEAPSVLVVPSAALSLYDDPQSKAWLDAYVASGGQLIVLAQMRGADWEKLPGGVTGLGYQEDILCLDQSVDLVNPSHWLSGVAGNRPNLQLDGSFISWPSDATVLLMRTTGNRLPAMIEYPYGSGSVLATSLFPDFMLQSGMSSADDITFARSLFSEAHFAATGESPAVIVEPAAPLPVTFDITNNSVYTLSSLTGWPDYYDSSLGLSINFARANFRTQDVSETVEFLQLDPPILPDGDSRSVQMTLDAPARPGIYRSGYWRGNKNFFRPTGDYPYRYPIGKDEVSFDTAGARAGDFYQVRSAAFADNQPIFQLQTNQDRYLVGDTVIVTSSVTNRDSVARTFTVQALVPEFGLVDSQTVTVAPNATESVTYSAPFRALYISNSSLLYDRWEFALSEAGDTISRNVVGLRYKVPDASMSLKPVSIVSERTEMVTATMTIRDITLPVGSEVTWSLTGQNLTLPLALGSTPIAGSGLLSSTLVTTLPALPLGSYEVVARVGDTGQVVWKRLSAQAPSTIVGVVESQTYRLGATVDNALSAAFLGASDSGTLIAQTQLYSGTQLLTTAPSSSAPLTAAGQSLALAVTMPRDVDLGIEYQAVVSATAQLDDGSSYTRRFTDTLTLVGPVVDAVSAEIRANEPITLNVRERGLELNSAEPFTVTFGSSTLTVNGDTELAFDLPIGTAPGNIPVIVQSPHVAGWVDSTTVLLPAPDFDTSVAVDATTNSVDFTSSNIGGIDTVLTGTLFVVDQSIIITEVNFVQSAVLDTPFTINVPLPNQIASGNYRVRCVCTDALGISHPFNGPISIAGLEADLTTQTDLPIYLSNDIVESTTTITTSEELDDANLRLRVLRLGESGGWDGWQAELASGSRQNSVSQTITPSLSFGWDKSDGAGIAPIARENTVYWVVEQEQGPFSNSNTTEHAAPLNQVQAFDAADGTLLWQRSIWNVRNIATNSSNLFVLTESNLEVFELDSPTRVANINFSFLGGDSGAEQPIDLWVSDEALIVATDSGFQDDNFYFFDINNLPNIETADDYMEFYDGRSGALVGGDFYLGFEEYGSRSGESAVRKIDATTGSEIWTSYFDFNDTYHTLVAANETYVVVAHEQVPDFPDRTIQSVDTLRILSTSTGEIVHDVPINLLFGEEFQYVLFDDALYYIKFRAGRSTDRGFDYNDIYEIDLASGDNSLVFIEDAIGDQGIQTFVGTGNNLHFVSNYLDIVSISRDGDYLDYYDLDSDLNSTTVDAMAVSSHGILLLENGGQHMLAIQAATPLDGGSGNNVDVVEVLREEWVTVNDDGTFAVPYNFDTPDLTDDPRARGHLWHEANLYSKVPGDETDLARRQLLDSDIYPFQILDALGTVHINASKPQVRVNVADYAADDAAATVQLSGIVRNTSGAAGTVQLTVTRDGVTVYSESFANMAVDEQRSFAFSDAGLTVGTTAYVASTDLDGDSDTAQVVAIAPLPSANVEVEPSLIELGNSAEIILTLNNPADVPSFVTVGTPFDQTVELRPQQALTLTTVITPASAGFRNDAIPLSGDRSGNVIASYQVCDNQATGSITLSGPQLGANYLPDPAMASSLTLVNSVGYTFDVLVDYAVPGRSGSQSLTLSPGSTVFSQTLGALPLGNYTAAYTITDAATGDLLDAPTLPFAIVEPNLEVTVNIADGPIVADGMPITVTSRNLIVSDMPFDGTLLLEGALTGLEPLMLSVGASAETTGTLSANVVGRQTITATLFDKGGTALAVDTYSLLINPNPISNLTLIDFVGGSGIPGGTVVLTGTVLNPGPEGEALLTLTLFDDRFEQWVTLDANGTTDVVFELPVPNGLIANQFPATLVLEEQSLDATVTILGAEITLEQQIDRPFYDPFATAQWDAIFTGVSGGTADYEVQMRFHGETYTEVVTIGAGDTVTVTYPVQVGPIGERGTVTLANVQANSAEDNRYALIIDSQWFPVRPDARVWLQSDKPSYDAGETVNFTIHIEQPANLAYVLRAPTLAPDGEPLLWNSLPFANTAPISFTIEVSEGVTETVVLTDTGAVQGSFDFTYELPLNTPTGRYHFVYGFESAEHTHPIDVHGVTLRAEELEVDGVNDGPARATMTPITLSADVIVNIALPNVRIRGFAIAPDGKPLSLGESATIFTSLAAGSTRITLDGLLDASQPGRYLFFFEVSDADTLAVLDDVAVTDRVDGAVIDQLVTDRGVYAPAQPGEATLTAYGNMGATLVVTASGGAVLYDAPLAVDGYQQISFPIPTETVRDEVLTALLTSSNGRSDKAQAAYKVSASFDVVQPEAAAVNPPHLSYIPLDPADHTVLLTGVYTEDVAIKAVLVDGVTATLGTGGTWSLPVTLEAGMNVFTVVAIDEAGNVGLGPLHELTGVPDYGMTISAESPQTINVPFDVTVVITSAETVSLTSQLPLSPTLQAPARSGFAFSGVVSPTQPVTLTWSVVALQAGEIELLGYVAGYQQLPKLSNRLPITIEQDMLAVRLSNYSTQRDAGRALLAYAAGLLTATLSLAYVFREEFDDRQHTLDP